MKFENTEVWGIKHAIRGMRNPLESWSSSDSEINENGEFELGFLDKNLAQGLILRGQSHSKFMRQIMVSVDITAPLYWWKEFDTYKVGTTANSTSTMHKLAQTEINSSNIHTNDPSFDSMMIGYLEGLRQEYVESFENSRDPELSAAEQQHALAVSHKYWEQLIKALPGCWEQKRTVTMNYEVLRNLYFQRNHHRLREWSVWFMSWIKELPYSEELITFEKTQKEEKEN